MAINLGATFILHRRLIGLFAVGTRSGQRYGLARMLLSFPLVSSLKEAVFQRSDRVLVLVLGVGRRLPANPKEDLSLLTNVALIVPS